MGYRITIGNAEPTVPTEDDDNQPGWAVIEYSHPEAPVFPGDDMTGNTNVRSPSYTVWAEFCREAGLYDLFFGASTSTKEKSTREVCLMPRHPGVALLRRSDLLEIRQARERCAAKRWTGERVPGWDPTMTWTDTREPDPKYDGCLARLLWLEWWVEWALTNCKTPALGNG